MPDEPHSPEFHQLANYYDSDLDEMTPLLIYLDGPENTPQTTEDNAEALRLNRKDTALFVHEGRLDPEDENTTQLLTMAVANRVWLPTLEGWVDDVVTHEGAGKRGLGRAAMETLHKWFAENGVEIIRLTNGDTHPKAAKLYLDLGYEKETTATIWRSYLNKDNTSVRYAAPKFDVKLVKAMHELKHGVGSWPPIGSGELYRQMFLANQSDTSQIIVGRNRQGEVTRTAVAADCRIMTREGHKAWLYGVTAESVDERVRVIKDAHRVLKNAGAKSVNIMTFEDRPEDQALIPALKATGYKERNTTLYTLDRTKKAA